MAESRAEPGSPPILLGVSLKLYLDVERTARWAHDVAAIARSHLAVTDGSVELFVLPSLPAVPLVVQELAGTPVRVGAQDLHWDDRGAYTGAVSGQDLRTVGCALVEVGHAERRQIFGETDDVIGAKVAAAFRNGLVPVLCVGEHEPGSSTDAAHVCISQIESALRKVQIADAEIIIAYEPEWAIGQAEAASADHVRAVAATLADRLRQDPRFATVRVVYGGSAQPGTLTDLRGDVDGLFLGRYAHDPAELARIIDEAAALR
ncbi:triose-phosphate isomerase family protein [Microbacterium schleiferi]|uniref:triose-phosphate isomerase family protein n=1 Tax=Microbacterium schleiferi TaxID=69362 RepID=UPI00311E9D7E